MTSGPLSQWRTVGERVKGGSTSGEPELEDLPRHPSGARTSRRHDDDTLLRRTDRGSLARPTCGAGGANPREPPPPADTCPLSRLNDWTRAVDRASDGPSGPDEEAAFALVCANLSFSSPPSVQHLRLRPWAQLGPVSRRRAPGMRSTPKPKVTATDENQRRPPCSP